MRRFLHLCLDRTPVIGLLMAALLFRALIPAGFMPTVASDGTIVMELCSGFTTKTVQVPIHDHAADDTGGPILFDHAPCGFAVASTAAPPPPAPTFAALVTPHAHANGLAATLLFLPSIHRAQAPRGPPLA